MGKVTLHTNPVCSCVWIFNTFCSKTNQSVTPPPENDQACATKVLEFSQQQIPCMRETEVTCEATFLDQWPVKRHSNKELRWRSGVQAWGKQWEEWAELFSVSSSTSSTGFQCSWKCCGNWRRLLVESQYCVNTCVLVWMCEACA